MPLSAVCTSCATLVYAALMSNYPYEPRSLSRTKLPRAASAADLRGTITGYSGKQV